MQSAETASIWAYAFGAAVQIGLMLSRAENAQGSKIVVVWVKGDL